MFEPPLLNEVASLSWLETLGFDYLSKKHFLLLKEIPDLIKNIKHHEKRETIGTREKTDASRHQLNQSWAAKLNRSQTWKDFENSNPENAHRFQQLHKLWENQKEFVFCTNEWLSRSLSLLQIFLSHTEKACLEFNKHRGRLPKGFALRYGRYLNGCHAALLKTQRQIVYAMFSRLKTASMYSAIALEKKENVDDVLFYITDHLSILNVIDPAEKIPAPHANLTENYQIQFYDAVKHYGQSEEEKQYADAVHWSAHLGAHASFLTPPKKEISHKNTFVENGLILVKTGENNKTKIAVPNLLKKFIPSKRRTPAWFFWEEHKILDFWEKRQSFLFKLHHVCPGKLSPVAQLQFYQNLIETELQALKLEDAPLLAFDFKNMRHEWKKILDRLYLGVSRQKKEAENQLRLQNQKISPEPSTDKNDKKIKAPEKIDVDKMPLQLIEHPTTRNAFFK